MRIDATEDFSFNSIPTITPANTTGIGSWSIPTDGYNISYDISCEVPNDTTWDNSMVEFDITDYIDKAMNQGVDVSNTTNDSSVTIYNIAPSLSYVDISTNNSDDSAVADVSDTVNLQFISNHQLEVPQVTFYIANAPILSERISTYPEPDTSLNWSSSFRVIQQEEGQLTFNIEFEDKAGNLGTPVTQTTTGNSVFIETNDPSMILVQITSNNPLDSGKAGIDDIITLHMETDVSLNPQSEVDVSFVIGNHVVDHDYITVSGSGKVWDASFQVLEHGETDYTGDVTFTIFDYYNEAGVGPGLPRTSTTDGSSIMASTVRPKITVSDISTNNTNDLSYATINDTISIEITSNSDVSAVQPYSTVEYGGTSYDLLPLASSNFSDTLTLYHQVTTSGVPKEQITYTIRNLKNDFDDANIEVQGTPEIYVDTKEPLLSTVEISSNNIYSQGTAAKGGDIVTLSFRADEPLYYNVPSVSFSIAGTTYPGTITITPSVPPSSTWDASFVVPSTSNGDVSFNISDFRDYVGNVGDSVVSTTNVSHVTVTNQTPGPPTNLSGVPDGDRDGHGPRVTLSWTAPANTGGGIHEYEISHNLCDDWIKTNSSSNSYTVTGLTADTQYEFVVRTINIVDTHSIDSSPSSPISPFNAITLLSNGVTLRANPQATLNVPYSVNNIPNYTGEFWIIDSSANGYYKNRQVVTTHVNDMSSWFSQHGSYVGSYAIESWDTSNVQRMDYMFYGASEFQGDISRWDTSSVHNMEGMFWNASTFDADISGWDVSDVTNMKSMFEDAFRFDADIGNWNTSNVTNMTYMFFAAEIFNQDISGWDVTNIHTRPYDFSYDANPSWKNDTLRQPQWSTNPRGIYLASNQVTLIAGHQTVVDNSYNYNGNLYLVISDNSLNYDFVTNLSSHNMNIVTSKVTNMSGLFNGAISTPTPSAINTWDTASVIDMSEMFRASNLNLDIRYWNTSSVQNMEQMFYGNAHFDQDISQWDVRDVSNMSQMFYGANIFDKDIGEWDVSGVTNMSGMFDGAISFNQDIGKWNTSNVTDMNNMFSGALGFDQDISGWNVSKVNTQPPTGFNAATQSTWTSDEQPKWLATQLSGSAGIGEAHLSWTVDVPSTTGLTYDYQQQVVGGSWGSWTQVTGTSKTVTGLTGGTHYNFRIRTQNPPNTYYALSNIVNIIPQAEQPPPRKPTKFKMTCNEISWYYENSWWNGRTPGHFEYTIYYTGHAAGGGSGGPFGSTSDAYVGPASVTNTVGSDIYSVSYDSTHALSGSVRAVTDAGDSSARASGSPDCNSGGSSSGGGIPGLGGGIPGLGGLI